MLSESQKKRKAAYEAEQRRKRNDPSYTVSDQAFLSTIDSAPSSSSCSSSGSYSDSGSSGGGCD